MIGPHEALAAEEQNIGRPCRRITFHASVFHDDHGNERSLALLVYDASNENQGQTRYAVFLDDGPHAQFSGVI